MTWRAQRNIKKTVKDEDKLQQEITQVLQKVPESTPTSLYSDEELQLERKKKLSLQNDLDKQQWQEDVEEIRKKRVGQLITQFPEVTMDLQNRRDSSDQEIDIYTKVKTDVFDYYKNRLEKIGRTGRNIDDYKYQEQAAGQEKKFDREKPNDIMLVKLRELVQRLEQRERKRNET